MKVKSQPAGEMGAAAAAAVACVQKITRQCQFQCH